MQHTFYSAIGLVLLLSMSGCGNDSGNSNMNDVDQKKVDSDRITDFSSDPVLIRNIDGKFLLSPDASRSVRRALSDSEIKKIESDGVEPGIPMATIEVDGVRYSIGSPAPPGLYKRTYKDMGEVLFKHKLFYELGTYASLVGDSRSVQSEIDSSLNKLETWFDD